MDIYENNDLKNKVLEQNALSIYHDTTDINQGHDPLKMETLKNQIKELINNSNPIITGDVIRLLKNLTLETCFIAVDNALEDLENENKEKFMRDLK